MGHKIAWALLVIGGLNWGLVALNFNLVNTIFGGLPWLERVVYALVGVSALMMLAIKKCCWKGGKCKDGKCEGGKCKDGKCEGGRCEGGKCEEGHGKCPNCGNSPCNCSAEPEKHDMPMESQDQGH